MDDVFMTDMSLWPKMNEIYREYFPNDPPARTAVGLTALPLPDLLLEMECVAEVGSWTKTAHRLAVVR